jgi:delta 1-pyrroline-5-carboxylate dehydrogenase
MPKAKLTQHELIEMRDELKDVADALRAAATGKPLEGYKEAVVAAKATALVRHADFLEGAAERLLGLIPDVPVKTPPKE